MYAWIFTAVATMERGVRRMARVQSRHRRHSSALNDPPCARGSNGSMARRDAHVRLAGMAQRMDHGSPCMSGPLPHADSVLADPPQLWLRRGTRNQTAVAALRWNRTLQVSSDPWPNLSGPRVPFATPYSTSWSAATQSWRLDEGRVSYAERGASSSMSYLSGSIAQICV